MSMVPIIFKTTGIRQQTFTFDTITGNLVLKGFRQGVFL
jgi:hypothetical protein